MKTRCVTVSFPYAQYTYEDDVYPDIPDVDHWNIIFYETFISEYFLENGVGL